MDKRHAFDRSGIPVLIMRGSLAVLTAAALVGCSTPSTGVVPRGDGMSTITRQGNGAWVTTESLKIAALRTPATTAADELRKLADLKADGILSSEEFDAAKRKLLKSP